MKLTLSVKEKMLERDGAWGLGAGNGFHRNKGEWNRLYGEGKDAWFLRWEI